MQLKEALKKRKIAKEAFLKAYHTKHKYTYSLYKKYRKSQDVLLKVYEKKASIKNAA